MKNSHVTGKSIFLDDIPEIAGTLHGVVFTSPVAHGKITRLDYTKALALEGVRYIFSATDITGDNQIGNIILDEPLFAEREVHFIGNPILFVVAETEKTARRALKLIELEISPLPIITDPREAHRLGQYILPPRTFKQGNTGSVWGKCAHIIEETADIAGQEHLYLETQGAYVIPKENGQLLVHSSTQGPTAVQKTIARVLGIPMHRIEVDVRRLGGGFGGKEDQATPWAVMAALAAFQLQAPVKIILDRKEDLLMTGKRHPYAVDFKIGLTEDLKILAFEADYYQNAGAAADLSPAIMERTLFHATGSYFIPNVRATVFSCKTNLPPMTAFRGFGAPQGMFVIEAAIAKTAEKLGIPAREIQRKNLLQEQDVFHYGQVAENVEAQYTWQKAMVAFDVIDKEKEIADFNRKNDRWKRGIAVMPLCFGISFTKTTMNHARALVHIYQDGSIGVSTGAVEMGQDVNLKMSQVASQAFSVGRDKIKIETTNTTRVANTSPTAASATADLNGKALQIAAGKLLERLKTTAADLVKTTAANVTIKDGFVYKDDKKTTISWEKLIETAFLERVNLSAVGHYATPGIHFDKTKEKGHPFAYHVYGTAVAIATIDTVLGTYHIDSVEIVHDFGKSMNTLIDRGQIEGGVVQGIGWLTLEELAYDGEGRLLSGSLSTYKVPDIYSVPDELEIVPLVTDGHELAILKSKAVGEPPFMYGIAVYFAIQNAIKAYNPSYAMQFKTPMTHERVFLSLHQNN